MYDGTHSIQIIPTSLLVTDDEWSYDVFNDGMWRATGVLIGKNTWEDFHLIPDGRPTVSMPDVKEEYVDIQALDGSYDLTEAVSGRPIFSNRTGSWDFYVDNYHEHWATIYSKLANYMHGKKVRVVLMDDPGFFYEGRLKLNQYQSGEWNSKISIDYTLAPYKKESINSLTPWLWDPFNFETGVIRDYTEVGKVAVNNTAKLHILRTNDCRIIPEFDIVGNAGFRFGVGTEDTEKYYFEDSGNNVHVIAPSSYTVYNEQDWIWITKLSGESNAFVRVYYRGRSL